MNFNIHNSQGNLQFKEIQTSEETKHYEGLYVYKNKYVLSITSVLNKLVWLYIIRIVDYWLYWLLYYLLYYLTPSTIFGLKSGLQRPPLPPSPLSTSPDFYWTRP